MDDLELKMQQFGRLKNNRGTWENQWQQVSDFCLGRRDFPSHDQLGGRARQYQGFDTTFQQGADQLSAALQTLLVNASSRWFWMADMNPQAMLNPALAEYYNVLTDGMYSIFNSPDANFGPQMHETLMDIVAFGTGVMYVEWSEQTQSVVFQSRPLSESYIMENSRGRVDTVYRSFRYTSRQAYDLWGEKAGEKCIENCKEGRGDTWMEFLHVVEPQKFVKHGSYSSERFPFRSVYINTQERKVVEEGGYQELPYLCARWSKDSGEFYGRGPGITALPDAKMLNRMARTLLASAEKAADPPILMTDDGILSPVRTEPGGINIVRPQPGGGVPLSYLENRARMDIPMERFQTVKSQVQAAFYHQLLETFDDPRMSATQGLELSSRTAQLIGPMIFRLQTELLEPMLARVAGLGIRSGILPPPPEELGAMPQIRYVSPAARAQQNSDVQSIMGLTNTLMQWSQLNPDILDNIDMDKAARELGEAFGNASAILRPIAEIQEIRAAKNEAQQREQQMQELTQGAEAAGKAAPMLEMLQGGGAEG